MESINKQIAKGATWMVGFKILEKSIGLISTLILVRLLTPDDFGLVAMAMIVVGFIELIRAFNFDVFLIQNQTADNDHYNTAWTFNVITGLLLAFLMILLTPLAISFYSEPRIELILYTLSIAIAVSGFENIGVVAFRKELTFNKEFSYLLGKKLIGFTIGISLALYYKNFWALVGGILASRIGEVVLSYLVHNYRPAICLRKWREMIGFSFWLLINNFLTYANIKVPEIAVGKFFGSKSLGLFNVSFEISNLATTELVAPINRAVFPGYAKLNENLNALRESFLLTISIIAILSFPIAIGISAISPLLVPIIMGEKWLDAIDLISILAISGAFFSIQTNAGYIFLAIGKPKILTLLSLFRLSILLIAIIIGAQSYNMLGISFALLSISIVMTPIIFWFVSRTLHIKPSILFMKLFKPIVISLLMYWAVSIYISSIDTINIATLIVAIILGGTAYTLLTLLVWLIFGKPDGAEKTIIFYVINLFKRTRLNYS